PAAEALLRHQLEKAGIDVRVRSAGLLSGNQPASSHGVRLLEERGIDMSTHRSQTMTRELLQEADLVLAMAREHVREAVVQLPEAWPRTFTLKELVRRGLRNGPRHAGEPFDAWLAQIHAGRNIQDLMGASGEDDVADPIGQPRAAYERMVTDLTDLLDRMVWLIWGEAEHRSEPAFAHDGSDA
ncbi:MAG: hypothetical protein ABR540_16280, partial [Acidimicrobiales bacterium]